MALSVSEVLPGAGAATTRRQIWSIGGGKSRVSAEATVPGLELLMRAQGLEPIASGAHIGPTVTLLNAIARWPSVAALGDRFAGVPMVIVAPGPSLARNIDQLRGLHGRAIITAFSHSLRPVLAAGVVPDLICLGKGLGGGLPISAVVGSAAVMHSWRREAEVVHTATFSGSPLAASTAIATLDTLQREHLPERAAQVGTRYLAALRTALAGSDHVREVRGCGLMLGIDLGERPGAASKLMRSMLERGYITSTGGGRREVLVLTPALNIDEDVLLGSVPVLAEQVAQLG